MISIGCLDMSRAMQSPTDTLMNLTANRRGDGSSASLALVATSGSEMKVISEMNIAGLLAPDLLSYSVSTLPPPYIYYNLHARVIKELQILRNGNSANFFSYVCNGKKIKELFTPS